MLFHKYLHHTVSVITFFQTQFVEKVNVKFKENGDSSVLFNLHTPNLHMSKIVTSFVHHHARFYIQKVELISVPFSHHKHHKFDSGFSSQFNFPYIQETHTSFHMWRTSWFLYFKHKIRFILPTEVFEDGVSTLLIHQLIQHACTTSRCSGKLISYIPRTVNNTVRLFMILDHCFLEGISK